MDCVKVLNFAILINGIPKEFFQLMVGLRQGYPLFPFLFILCADALSRALRMAMQQLELELYWPTPVTQPLSYLHFADDYVLINRALIQNAGAFVSLLRPIAVPLVNVSTCKDPRSFSVPSLRSKWNMLSVIGCGPRSRQEAWLIWEFLYRVSNFGEHSTGLWSSESGIILRTGMQCSFHDGQDYSGQINPQLYLYVPSSKYDCIVLVLEGDWVMISSLFVGFWVEWSWTAPIILRDDLLAY